jgi:hypothetical protein
VCDTTGLKYYGSTTKKYLSARLGAHIYDYNKYLKDNKKYLTSYQVLENKNYKIVLVENYACNSKDELFQRERYFIENNDCVNKYIPIRTDDEKEEVNKDTKRRYYEKSKEKILEHNKLYREVNKEAFKKMKDDYRLNNKEKVQAYRKEYYNTHKK